MAALFSGKAKTVSNFDDSSAELDDVSIESFFLDNGCISLAYRDFLTEIPVEVLRHSLTCHITSLDITGTSIRYVHTMRELNKSNI